MEHVDRNHLISAPLGQHLIAEFHGAVALVDCEPVSDILRQAAEAAQATVLEIKLHDFGDRSGFTGVALLAESHISIHTWPEYGYAAIDMFMCGDLNPENGLGVLRDYFKPGYESIQIIPRGNPVQPGGLAPVRDPA